MNSNKTTTSGFMLVEILVSLSIFTLITVSTTGALLAIIDANAKAQTMRSAIDNMNAAIENMSRTMRTGTDFRCGELGVSGGPCATGFDRISFISQDSTTERVSYFWDGEKKSIKRQKGTSAEVTLTAPEVKVTNLTFYVYGNNHIDAQQPRVLMVINGQAGGAGFTGSSFMIQTTVTQRDPDCNVSSFDDCTP